MSPSVSVKSIETARGELRINYEYSTDGGEAQVNTNVFEVGNSQNATDLFQSVSGSGEETQVVGYNQGQGESVTWGVTVLIEEDGSFDQEQFDVTINADGSGSTPADIPVSQIGGGGGGGLQPSPGGGPFGLSQTELALLGLAASGVGIAYIRTR